jgi:hypothetical protein
MTLNRSTRLASAFEEAADTASRHGLGALAWQTLAACGARTDLPWTADDVTVWDAETMRAICAGCLVLTQCAAYVDQSDVCAGWWAGHDRDPDHAEPQAPAWVPVTVHRHPLPGVEQGVLPLGGAA